MRLLEATGSPHPTPKTKTEERAPNHKLTVAALAKATAAVSQALDDLLQFHRSLGRMAASEDGIGEVEEELGVAFPPELRALLLETNGLETREFRPVEQFPRLHRELNEQLEEDLKEGEPPEHPGDAYRDLRRHLPLSALVAIGTDFNGDTYFINPNVRLDGQLPVFRAKHDEPLGCSVVARSLADFVARIARHHRGDEVAYELSVSAS